MDDALEEEIRIIKGWNTNSCIKSTDMLELPST